MLRAHDEPPQGPVRDAFLLLDEEPVLDAELLALGNWIAAYYCAPLGEVLRTMIPLGGEIRKGRVYTLTDKGRDAGRQLELTESKEDTAVRLLRLLAARPLSVSYLKSKVPDAQRALKALEKRGFVQMEDIEAERDPLRASAQRLRVKAVFPRPDAKVQEGGARGARLPRPAPRIAQPGRTRGRVKGASEAARALARKGAVSLKTEPLMHAAGPIRVPHTLNTTQQAAYEQIRAASSRGSSDLPASRRHRVGQDRGLSERHRSGPGARPRARCCWSRRSR